MELTPREQAMLREMGVDWPVLAAPAALPSPVPTAPSAPMPVAVAPTPSPKAGASADWASADWASADWPALQDQVAHCQRCGLCQTRRKTVFGVGHPRAHWMILGEAPGEQEDRLGEPFVGPAGQLLDRMLASIGLSRSAWEGQDDQQDPHGVRDAVPADRRHREGADTPLGDPADRVFITNTVKCRPPQNRNPQPEELAACAPVLQRQIELVRPRLLLAMGRFAAQQLLATEEPIGRLRGRVHRLPTGFEPSGVPVVVTYHPAYLLRNPADKAKAWDDLCLALDTVSSASSSR